MALLLLAYGTAIRRPELVAFSLEDLTKDRGQITGIWLRKSKTDQFGTGESIPLSERVGSAIKEWTEQARIENETLLRAI